MNILEINKFYYLRRGAERHMLDVIRLFESQRHRVAVFAMHHSRNIPSSWERFFVSAVGYTAEDSTVWQHIVGIGRIFWSFEARRKIRQLLKEFQPDIVHIHNIYHQISPSILFPLKQSGATIVMTVHDYALISPDKDTYYDHIGQHYWKFLFVKKYSLIKRLLLILKMYFERFSGVYCKTVDVFIAPSRLVRQTLIRSGVDAHKIVVIPHFIALQSTTLSITAEKKRQRPYALYFGSISEEKGVTDLVHIFDQLQKPLVIAGSLESGLVLPQSDWVEYVGQQSRDELEKLIVRASCVVSASRLPETFGLIALETLSFGKPFFGLNRGALSEIIINNQNGFLVEDTMRLQKMLAEFFEGLLLFDGNSIKKNAYEKYSSQYYLQTFFETIEQRMFDTPKRDDILINKERQ